MILGDTDARWVYEPEVFVFDCIEVDGVEYAIDDSVLCKRKGLQLYFHCLTFRDEANVLVK